METHRSAVITPGTLDLLIGALAARGYRVLGPVVSTGRSSTTISSRPPSCRSGGPTGRTAARYRLERRADEARFGYAVGPAFVEALSCSRRESRLWRARAQRRGARDRGGAARRDAARIHRRSLVRAARDRDPGPGLPRRPARRPRLRRAPRRGVPRRRQLLRARRHLLLHLDGNGAEGRGRLRPGAHRAARRRAPVPRRGRQRARRRGAGRAPLPSGRARRPGRGRREHRVGRRRRWGGRWRPGTSATCWRGTSTTPAGTTSPKRCLTCGNCTLVCPTCFCSAVEDETDLSGEEASRYRVWDSCFSVDYSYIHGGSIRPSGRSRYRQWMTHKLGTWHDQFGSSGCVGCGRCIAWCPVGIDITEEVAAIRATEGSEHGRALRASSPRCPFFEGLGARELETVAGCGRQRPVRCRSAAVPRGRRGRHLLRRPARERRARDVRARTRPDDDRDDRVGRGDRLVVALRAVPLALRRAGADARCGRPRSTAPACAASATPTLPSATP